MINEDEQSLDGGIQRDESELNKGVRDKIKQLATNQYFGVLCTQGENQPYGSMIAFAFSENLRSFVFATPTATRKYKLLSECNHVALVVDNRIDHPNKMMNIEAMTVTAGTRELEKDSEIKKWAGIYTARHPHLLSFVRSESSALFVADVRRYLHVSRFQEVNQWIPGTP
jgi:uncharacterized protein YhbP (UPF0306 family)